MPAWITFTIWTYILSVPFYVLISHGGGASGEKFARRFRFMLWVPGAVAIGYRILSGIGFQDIPYQFTNAWLLLAALLLPILVEFLLIGIAIFAGWGQPAEDILIWKNGKIHVGENFGLLLKDKIQSPLRFGFNLLLSLLIGTLFTALFAVGSEVGWRGYLQTITIQTFGYTLGLVMVGLIWGYWLLPVVLGGYRYPYNPGLGGWILMPVTTVAYSLIAGWLYIQAGNIWAPAFFHASLMVTGDLSEVGLGKAGASLQIRMVSILLWYIAALGVGVLGR